MEKKQIGRIFAATLLIATGSAAQQAAQSTEFAAPQHGQVIPAYGKLPLTFEANQGQTSADARFIARGNGYSAFLTSAGMVLSLRPPKMLRPLAVATVDPAHGSSSSPKTTLQFNLLGATPTPGVVGEDQQPGRVNYFIGKDPARWRRNVPTYARVRYKNVYPGIDLLYYGSHQQLEYDFEISRSADPSLIQFEIKGANQLQLDANGDLVLKTSLGELNFQSPVVYQQSNGQRLPVDGGYVVKDATHVAFRLAHYDSSEPLVIDPVLVYSTYLGGSGDDEPHAIAIDSTGSIYVAGLTDSADFPNTKTFAAPGDFGIVHAFVAKLDPTGSSLVYADYLGGGGGEVGSALALDSSDNAYLTGTTGSSDFPTVNPYQSSLAGTTNVFLSEVSADGSSLLYSTYLGGNSSDTSSSIVIDSLGEVYVAGWTSSTNFPALDAYQPTVSPNQDGIYGEYAFVTKFHPDGQSLAYSTYLGGSLMPTQTCWNGPCVLPPSSRNFGLAVDANGNAYVGGVTATLDFPATAGAYLTSNSNLQSLPVGFVSKFDAGGSLAYSTYLYGSSGGETNIKAITVDSSGSAYVAGATSDGTFPITSTSICDPSIYGLGCNYTVVTKLDPTGASLLYSTYLGLNNNASPQAIALDANNDAYILGVSWGCKSFALVGGIESCGDVATSDLLLVEIDPTASTELFATFLGGSDDEYPAGIALDTTGNIYVGGETFSGDFPTTAGAFQNTLNGDSNVFLLKIAPNPAPAVSASPFLLQYASQPVGSSSPVATALLRNMGSSPLSISSVSVNGDFAVTNDCANTVKAAGNCTFSVTFAPTAAGPRYGSIVIQDDAAGSPHVIHLSGTAPGAVVALTPASLAFPGQSVGTPSAPQTVTLGNHGDTPLTLGTIQVTGDFTETNNCPATVPAASSCVITITFTPTSAGNRSGALTVSDSAQGPQTLALTGVGMDFSLASSTNSQTTSPGAGATFQLMVTPLGGSFTNAVNLSCSGLPAQATCSFTPNLVTPGGTPAPATLTVSTKGSVAAARPSRLFENGYLYAIWMPLQSIGLFGVMLASRRRRLMKWRLVTATTLGIVALLFMTGCAGSTGATSPLQSGTQKGTYNITVTGTSATLQHSVNLTLNLQ